MQYIIGVGCAFENVSEAWLTEGTFGCGQGELASYMVSNYWRHEERHTTGSGRCNRCIVVDLCCDCEACSLDAPGVVTPDTAPDISEPT